MFTRFFSHLGRGGLLLCALCLSACASNEAVITYAWMADDIDQKADREGVLVLAISKKPEPRQRFERAFTDALSKRGVRAVASYELNAANKIGKAEIIAMAEARDLDTVLITSFAGRDEQEVLHRGGTVYGVAPVYVPYGGYYGRGGVYGMPYEVGHVSDWYTHHKSLHLEANLYDISTEEHLWQAASGVTETEDNRQMVEAFIDAFIDQLQKDQLVR